MAYSSLTLNEFMRKPWTLADGSWSEVNFLRRRPSHISRNCHGGIRQIGQNLFHLGFYLPKNGAAKPPAPLISIVDCGFKVAGFIGASAPHL